jgi:hypothetical protein
MERDAACKPDKPIADSGRPDWSLPKDFVALERAQTARHRHAVGLPPIDSTAHIPGLAISGGGIRSAVFALGFMQALADKDVLKHFSYLSTVSGGSYIGAFYGSLFVPDELRVGNPALTPDVFAKAAARASCKLGPNTPAAGEDDITPLAYLRDNCNYLTPNGFTDILQSIVFSTRNWFAVQYVIGVALLTIVLLLNLVVMGIRDASPANFGLPDPCAWWIGPLMPIVAAAVLTVLIMSPLSRAYWLTQNLAQKTDFVGKWLPVCSIALVTLLAFGAVFVDNQYKVPPLGEISSRFVHPPFIVAGSVTVVVTGIIGLLYLAAAWFYVSRRRGSGKSWFPGSVTSRFAASDSRVFVDRLRNALSNAFTTPLHYNRASILTGPLQLAMWLVALALVDGLGAFIYSYLDSLQREANSHAMATTSSGVAALAALGGTIWAATKFVLSEGKGLAEGAMKLPRIVLATAGATLAALITLAFWSVIAHAITARLQIHTCDAQGASWSRYIATTPSNGHQITLIVVCLVLILLAMLDGACVQFLNLSTYQRLFSTRLTRAFLGATNRTRLNHAEKRDVTSLVAGDNVTMNEYYHRFSHAPVHLINATINKTIDWESSLVQRGARGLSFCIGPAGMTVGAKLGVLECDWECADDISTPATHVRANVRTRDIWLESMTLGDWIAISGAAVSTGLGRLTRPGYSLLLGIANIRLGYWWDTYSTPFSRGAETFERQRVPIPSRAVPRRLFSEKFFGTQFCLKRELLGEFDGPRARRWYLTDGGHFENTGAYELLRRQLEFIVILDNGRDLHEHFSDINTLIRQVRVDFSIEIDETATRLAHHAGIRINAALVATTFDDFRQRPECIAILLTTHFKSGQKGQLLIVKPRVTSGAPHDVRGYVNANKDFPNESTADQFFDDVQWESHRGLGYSQGAALFV